MPSRTTNLKVSEDPLFGALLLAEVQVDDAVDEAIKEVVKDEEEAHVLSEDVLEGNVDRAAMDMALLNEAAEQHSKTAAGARWKDPRVDDKWRMSNVTTDVGTLVVVQLGPRGVSAGRHFIAMHGMNAQTCWDTIALYLANGPSPMRVLLPKPHSNPNTQPKISELAVVRSAKNLRGLIPTACREQYLLKVLPKEGRVVMAGFSWGSGAVARFAAAYPDRVARLVLVSPDVELSVFRRLDPTLPILILWAKDDDINPYSRFPRYMTHPMLTLHTEETGGHKVLDSHADIIARWLATPDALLATPGGPWKPKGLAKIVAIPGAAVQKLKPGRIGLPKFGKAS